MTDVRPEYDVIKHGYVPTYKVGIYLQKTVIWRGHGGLSGLIRFFGGASRRVRGTSETFFFLRLGTKFLLWPHPAYTLIRLYLCCTCVRLDLAHVTFNERVFTYLDKLLSGMALDKQMQHLRQISATGYVVISLHLCCTCVQLIEHSRTKATK